MSPQTASLTTPECALASVSRISATILMITVDGHVDAANAQELSDCIEQVTQYSAQLIVDLSACEFFGTSGFFTLQRCSFACSRVGTNWRLVANREVRRVLDLCDPEGILPVCPTVPAAVASLHGESRGRLRLVEPLHS